MIKPQEFRIGVSVLWNKRPITIRNSTELANLTDSSTTILVEPIPLTPEILEKCGWVSIYNFDFGEGYQYRHDKLKAKVTKVADAIGFHIRFTDFTLEYQYLHQLQNLYFALCGEELTINL